MSRIGSSTYRLNTILVGLNCIEKGHGDGGSIAVTWQKPNGIDQAKNTAAQARKFACSGAIVLAADVFDAYLRDIVEEYWLRFSADTIGVATKSQTRPKAQGGAYSVAERTEAIANELNINNIMSIALIELQAKWRNIVAHDSERRVNLRSDLRSDLLDRRVEISKKFSHLRIDEAIKNFEGRKVPVPKEVTSLIANAVRLAQSIDETAIRRVASSVDEMRATVDFLLKDHFTRMGGKAARAKVADLFQGDQSRRAATLSKILENVGVTKSSKPISCVISEESCLDLISLSRAEFEKKYLAV